MSYPKRVIHYLILPLRCHAKNKEGEAESRARLEIVEFVERKKSDAPEFLKKIGDELVFRYRPMCHMCTMCPLFPMSCVPFLVLRGMSARFTALVNGNPEPEFEFSFNGVPLFPTDRIHITRERSGLIRLSMAFVEESDIGTYSLRVWNEHGETSCSAKLLYDGLEVQPDQSLGDLYDGFEKYAVSGLPMPLPDKPIITQVCLDWFTVQPRYTHPALSASTAKDKSYHQFD